MLLCGEMEKSNSNVVHSLPLPADVVQQWQLLQRTLASGAVSQPSTTVMQTTIHQSGIGNGGVTVQVQGAAVARPRMPAAAISYSYKVRIIYPCKKLFLGISTNILQNLSVNVIRMQLIEAFKDQVPDSMSFQLEGNQQAKISLVTDEDLKRLNDIHKIGGQINVV